MMNTRDRILCEALHQMNLVGVNRLGVREISRSLGISPGNMSYHFARKEDLLQALIALLSRENATIRAKYAERPCTLRGLMHMLRELFINQWKYRGLLADQVEVNRLLELNNDQSYADAHAKRVEWTRNYIISIPESEIQISDADSVDLSDVLSLMARFWIADAFIISSGNDPDSAIRQQMNRVTSLLRPFCTPLGRKILLVQ